jgi:hypothetical protein
MARESVRGARRNAREPEGDTPGCNRRLPINRNGGQRSSIGRLAARGHTLVTPASLPVALAPQVLDLLVGRVATTFTAYAIDL